MSDEDAYELGYAAVSKINDDIFAGEYNFYQVRKTNVEVICEPISHITNIEGLWASWLPIVEPATFTNFGKALGVFGAGVSLLSNLSTIAVLVEDGGGWSSLSTGEQLELISTSLSTIGAVVGLLPIPVAGQVAGAAISTVGCVVGFISTMVTVNFDKPFIFELLLDNGTKAYIYIG